MIPMLCEDVAPNKSLELTAFSGNERRRFSRLYTLQTRTVIVGGSSTQPLDAAHGRVIL